MPEFEYQGVNRSGQKVAGKIEAPNENELRVLLRAQGVRPVRIGKVGVLNSDLGAMLGGAGRVPVASLVIFTRQLYTLINSGVPLVQALDVLQEQTEHPGLKNIVTAVKEKVGGGTYFWEALAAYPKAIPKIMTALIRAGESAGVLDVMLKRLSRYLEDADRLRKMLRSAMIYPIAVIGIAFVVVTAMLVFVIPKFEELLSGGGQKLPGPTQFVIDLSHFLVDNAAPVFGGAATALFLGFRYVRSAEGKAFLDRLSFNLPLFGPLVQKAGVARFSRTMSTLLASGVPLVDSIDICRATIDNAVLEEAVSTIRADVESGKTLGGVVGKLTVFPRMAVQMISVGESTGNLDQMLEKVADFYEEEVEQMVGGLTKLIEPLLLVVLGGLVGGLMIAMYLPIFKLAEGAG